MKFVSRSFSLLRMGQKGLVALLSVLVVLAVEPAVAAQKGVKPPPTATSSPTPTPAPTPSGPAPIALADVATQAASVQNVLRSISDKLAANIKIDEIRNSVADATLGVNRDMAATMRTLQRHPALPTLQTMQESWQQRDLKYTEWLTALTKRSNEIQASLTQLAELQKIWVLTLNEATTSKAPGPIIQQVNQTIAAMQTAQVPLKEALTSILDLQSRVGNLISQCETVMAKISQVQQASVTGIFVQESLPIVSPALWTDARRNISENVRSAASSYRVDIANYFESSPGNRYLHAAVLAMMILLCLAARHQMHLWRTAGVSFSPAIRVFEHPVAAAITTVLFVLSSPYWSSLSGPLRDTAEVLALVPMIILIRPVVSPSISSGLYVLGFLFAMDAIRGILSGGQLMGQLFLIVESVTGGAVIIWFLRNLRPALGEATASSRLRLIQSVSFVLLLSLASGFLAAATGYLRLARLTTPGVLAGGVLALSLYASLRVFIGFFAFALRMWPLRTLNMVTEHSRRIERRLYLILILASIIGFSVRYLGYIGLLDPFLSTLKTIVGTKFERGAFSISLGAILEFILTVWVAYLLSSFLRFVLKEDVYPRIGIAPGKSYAVSGLLHYFILALGFTAAIAALGVNLTKLTVLTGAFGVGIGFGLQSVVNNFVSGLILLFERPVHVGDMVEIGDLLGYVRRIGIRASTVHTRQGADIVVPNSQFITEKVTNWTLSDKLRRIDFPVGVNYSASPKEVIKVLEGVANAHPQVLHDPSPEALFMGYGDSSINFELRAWTAEFENWQRVSSDLAVALYDAVHSAGMSFPFPQREVRILGDSDKGNTTDGQKEMFKQS